ncbi:MAG: glutamine amidotransferase family protein [Paracoccaceae bacterium]|jgi:amidophosphoribosyltransferase|nr:glutamine amidotransferase [Paracoccaceae bacterium]MDG1880185.1 glutamine amidotransferase family protein [Paracoccaceae bacterium]|tara:strand:+ start:6474 stop:7370 length:897 start_codon:yes stop_codon:yes gene_type:complete
MCGIVGLFLKDKSLELRLGEMLTDMLVTMSDRGPDSAGIAIYKSPNSSYKKITLQSSNPTKDFKNLKTSLDKLIHQGLEISIIDTHAIINFETKYLEQVKALLGDHFSFLKIMSIGDSIEIYKEVGPPETVANRFHLSKMVGSHGIGHTRMATESAVTTMGAHPFSTGTDQCLVHNGSLSNHNSLRRKLIKNGIKFETDNDTEVAAAYLTFKMNEGYNLGDALEVGLDELDGFYTFLVGTKSGFGVLRDPIACKPAVLAETDQYVAFGSEYRALVNLPNIDNAKVWEPEPATVYFWEH